jgi:hypothetical protein
MSSGDGQMIKDGHLVGRPLQPFFVADEDSGEMVENTTQGHGGIPAEAFQVKHEIQNRVFENGYFVHANNPNSDGFDYSEGSQASRQSGQQQHQQQQGSMIHAMYENGDYGGNKNVAKGGSKKGKNKQQTDDSKFAGSQFLRKPEGSNIPTPAFNGQQVPSSSSPPPITATQSSSSLSAAALAKKERKRTAQKERRSHSKALHSSSPSSAAMPEGFAFPSYVDNVVYFKHGDSVSETKLP